MATEHSEEALLKMIRTAAKTCHHKQGRHVPIEDLEAEGWVILMGKPDLRWRDPTLIINYVSGYLNRFARKEREVQERQVDIDG